MRTGRERVLQPQQVVDPQVAGVLGRLVGAVEDAVDERVGGRVLLARHRPDRPALEALERAQRLAVQRGELLVADAVLAGELLGDQLGVVDDLDLGGAERARPVEAEQQGAVLGDVVGGAAERDRRLVDDVAFGIRQHGRRRGRPGVATRAAVHVDDEAHALRRGQRRELARNARTPPVAHLALTAAVGLVAAL